MNYIIESDIDFYAELKKELNPSNEKIENTHITDTSSNYCLLTNQPLEDNYITLKCNHIFNYLPLYKEICYQKSINYLETTILYFNEIKCPYCREITQKLIPYIPHKDVLKYKRGVNYPAKCCMKLHDCQWINKSGKNKGQHCCSDAYKSNFGIFCYTHQSITYKNQTHVEVKNNIDWTDNHKILDKQYKIPELKTILKNNKLKVGGTKKQLIDRIITKNVVIDFL